MAIGTPSFCPHHYNLRPSFRDLDNNAELGTNLLKYRVSLLFYALPFNLLPGLCGNATYIIEESQEHMFLFSG
jgi:hypothetical protein